MLSNVHISNPLSPLTPDPPTHRGRKSSFACMSYDKKLAGLHSRPGGALYPAVFGPPQAGPETGLNDGMRVHDVPRMTAVSRYLA